LKNVLKIIITNPQGSIYYLLTSSYIQSFAILGRVSPEK